MLKSESIKSLAEALSKFQGQIQNIKKDCTNPYFNSKYASLDIIWEGIRKPLSENGLSLSQLPNGNVLTTLLLHSSGEWISCDYDLKPLDQKPQSFGGVLSYARRYALSAVLGIATEDDLDGNEPSESPAKKAYEQKKSSAKKEPKIQIMELCNKLEPNLKESKKYPAFVKSITGLDLVEGNFGEIVNRLDLIVQGKK